MLKLFIYKKELSGIICNVFISISFIIPLFMSIFYGKNWNKVVCENAFTCRIEFHFGILMTFKYHQVQQHNDD